MAILKVPKKEVAIVLSIDFDVTMKMSIQAQKMA